MTCMKTNPEVVSAYHMPDGVCVGIRISMSRDDRLACVTNSMCVFVSTWMLGACSRRNMNDHCGA